MADQFEEQAWVKFGVAAAMAKQYAVDQHRFFEDLAGMLERVLPDATEVVRQGGFFSKKIARRITVTLGEFRFALEAPERGPMAAGKTHLVRGIALRTEPLAVPEWLDEVGGFLDERARDNQAARDALQNFVG